MMIFFNEYLYEYYEITYFNKATKRKELIDFEYKSYNKYCRIYYGKKKRKCYINKKDGLIKCH